MLLDLHCSYNPRNSQQNYRQVMLSACAHSFLSLSGRFIGKLQLSFNSFIIKNRLNALTYKAQARSTVRCHVWLFALVTVQLRLQLAAAANTPDRITQPTTRLETGQKSKYKTSFITKHMAFIQ